MSVESNDGDVFRSRRRSGARVRAKKKKETKRQSAKTGDGARNAARRKNARFAAAAVSRPADEGIDVAPARAARAPFSSHVRASSPCVTLGRARFAGCSPVVLALLALARARGRGASRAALVRCALCLAATQVLELYQIAPFVLQLDARAAPVTARVGGGKEVSGVCAMSSRGARNQAPRRVSAARPRAPPDAHSVAKKRRLARPSSRTRDSRISSYPRSRAFEPARSAACERTEGNARRLPRGVAGRARARSAGHALEHFEVHVVSHLLPGADAVLLHGVAQRLLLRGVPVPSEGHLRRLAPRLGLRLGFHRAVRAARCGPGAIQRVRAQSATPLESERTRPTRSPAAALASCRARGNERRSRGARVNARRKRPEKFGAHCPPVTKKVCGFFSRVTDRTRRRSALRPFSPRARSSFCGLKSVSGWRPKVASANGAFGPRAGCAAATEEKPINVLA